MEAATPTGWVPEGKPVWLTELGCPALDKGANQPNVFYDPKSAQSALPYYSDGSRDDLQQRAYLDAYQRFFDVDHPGFLGSNPVSSVYGGRMVDPAHLHVWAWDARPYPYFPDLTDVWSDGENWERGHWTNGRLGAVTLEGLIAAVLADHAFADFAVSDAHAFVGGMVVNGVLSARGALEPVLQAFRVDAADAGERVLFRGRRRPDDAALDPEMLGERPDEPLVARRRAQETELASELVLRFVDVGQDYRLGTATSRRLVGGSRRTSTIELPAAIERSEAERLTDTLLRDIWAGRESAELVLPPSALAIDAGDIVSLTGGARPERLMVERVEDGTSRSLSLRRVDVRGPGALTAPGRRPPATTPLYGAPVVQVLDIAPVDGDAAHAPRFAVFADPWPGVVAVYRAAEGGGFRLVTTLTARATMGRLTAALPAGAWGVFDRANAVEVELFGGTLSGLPGIDVLNGGNAAAVQTVSGAWEVLQFAEAELVGPRRYRLTKLLRGQSGSEQAMAGGAEAGAPFVLLDGAVTTLPVGIDQLGLPLRFRFGPSRDDHAGPTFTEMTVTASGFGLVPFAPVHLSSSRDAGSGDVALSWTRRTRFGGIGWELTEVPLNEEREAYRVEILDDAVVKRTVETEAPALLYTAAAQAEDFGAPAHGFGVRVAQLSATVGAGRALETVVDV